MDHIFYTFAILAILWEMNVFIATERWIERRKRLTAATAETMTNEQRYLSLLLFGYIVWTVVGLFTSQWLWFAAYLLLGFIPKPNMTLKKIDALISVFVLIFLVINKYHLNIDLQTLIFG